MKRWPSIFRTLPQGIIQPYLELCAMLAYSEAWHARNPGIFRTLPQLHFDAYSEPCHINKSLQKFKTLTYLKPDRHSEPSIKDLRLNLLQNS